MTEFLRKKYGTPLEWVYEAEFDSDAMASYPVHLQPSTVFWSEHFREWRQCGGCLVAPPKQAPAKVEKKGNRR